MFPIVYAHGLEPSGGPGLLFISLTSAFANMTGGWFVGFMFFALVGIAALSSAISLIEPSLAWATERFGMKRAPATIMIGAAVWFVGLSCVLSFNHWSEVQFLGRTIFDLFADATDMLLLPLGWRPDSNLCRLGHEALHSQQRAGHECWHVQSLVRIDPGSGASLCIDCTVYDAVLINSCTGICRRRSHRTPPALSLLNVWSLLPQGRIGYPIRPCFISGMREVMPAVSRSALIMHSAREMYDLVADVESYPEFLPWCSGARIVQAGRRHY